MEEIVTVVKPFVSINLYKYKSSTMCLHIDMITQEGVHVTTVKFSDESPVHMEKEYVGSSVRYQAFIQTDYNVLGTYQTVNILINYKYTQFTRFVELGHRMDVQQRIDFAVVHRALVAFLRTPYEYGMGTEICATMHDHIYKMVYDVYSRYDDPTYDEELINLWKRYRHLLDGNTEFTSDMIKNMHALTYTESYPHMA